MVAFGPKGGGSATSESGPYGEERARKRAERRAAYVRAHAPGIYTALLQAGSVDRLADILRHAHDGSLVPESFPPDLVRETARHQAGLLFDETEEP